MQRVDVAAGMLKRPVELFGMRIHPLTMPESVAAVLDMAVAPRGDTLRFVVTPNVDHVVQFESNPVLRAAYADAALVLADGKPVVAASRLLNCALPGTVPGSDLVPACFEVAEQRQQALRIYLFGAMPGVADAAAAQMRRRWPVSAQVVGAVSPDFGFDKDPAACERYIDAINEADPDILLVGLGMPKQELFVHRHQARIKAGIALCVGATIDFLAGHKSRAPVFVQRAGLEWLYRAGQEPRRLVKRYAHDAMVFPGIVLKEFRKRKAS